MPSTNSIASSVDIKTLRRSPRFITPAAAPPQQKFPNTRRSLRFLQKNEVSPPTLPEFRQVHSSDASLRPSKNVSLKTPKSIPVNTPRKSSKPRVVSSINEDSNTGSKKSSTFENGVVGIRVPRRSPRLSYVPKIDNALEGRNAKVSKSSIASGGRLSDLKNPSPKLRRSPRLNNVVGGHQNVSKSQSFSGQKDALEKSSRRREKSSASGRKMGLLHVKNVDASLSSHGGNVAEGERRRKGKGKENSVDHEGIAAKGGGTQGVDGEMEKKSVARRKRKRENDVGGIRQGWTKDQEAALQRAYFVAKPTPKFWKKVSKLVPGKSAQDCFDKVHSDHLTPPQPRPRSRTQSTKSSQIELLSLSAGKLLNLDGAKPRKPSRKSQKSHNAQKTVRYLLEKNFQGAISCEADFFSQLEPDINLSNHTPLPSKQLYSTKDLQGNQGFLHERSSSNHKTPLSRFSSPVERVVSAPLLKQVSPPVLKQVKNRALHEKYIDQLHCREAKRKSMSKSIKNRISKEKGLKEVHAARTIDLSAAKNALISDARDAIHQLQHLNANAMSDVPEFDDGDDYYAKDDFENLEET